MTKIIKLTMLFAFCSVTLFAQKDVPPPPESKPDTELKCDEADARIKQIKNRIQALTKSFEDVRANVVRLEAEIAAQNKKIVDCNDEMLRLIGATQAELDAFRQRLGVIDGRVRQMQNLSNDVLADRRSEILVLENDLNELRRNKLSVIPDFFDRIVALARDIRGLLRERRSSTYTVGTWAQDRDCLWNIAGRMEIYSDPFQWPKIWQANTNIINNPDIIHPGQVLQIPPAGPLTDSETRASRVYYRNKAAAQTQTQAQGE